MVRYIPVGLLPRMYAFATQLSLEISMWLLRLYPPRLSRLSESNALVPALAWLWTFECPTLQLDMERMIMFLSSMPSSLICTLHFLVETLLEVGEEGQ